MIRRSSAAGGARAARGRGRARASRRSAAGRRRSPGRRPAGRKAARPGSPSRRSPPAGCRAGGRGSAARAGRRAAVAQQGAGRGDHVVEEVGRRDRGARRVQDAHLDRDQEDRARDADRGRQDRDQEGGAAPIRASVLIGSARLRFLDRSGQLGLRARPARQRIAGTADRRRGAAPPSTATPPASVTVRESESGRWDDGRDVAIQFGEQARPRGLAAARNFAGRTADLAGLRMLAA